MTAEEKFQRFKPFLLVRTLWLLSLFAFAWQAGEGSVPQLLLVGIAGAFFMQGLMLILGLLKRLSTIHDLLSNILAALLASAALGLFPTWSTTILLFALVPFLDLARTRGMGALTLLFLFPLPLVAYDFIAEEPALPDWGLLLAWSVPLLLGTGAAAIKQQEAGVPTKEKEAKEESPESIITKVAQMLARETNYQRIVEVLARGGAEMLDSRKSRGKAMVVTFKPGLHDTLIVAAIYNMEQNLLNRSFDLKGVLGTLLQDGDPIDTDSNQPPFDEFRGLQDHRILLFPLRTGIDVYGAVMFATKDHARVDNVEVQRTLIALADQASLALHNAVLQQELRRKQDERLGGEEEARHQLARDLHDGPVQRVAAISMQLEFVKALMKRDPERAVEELGQLQQVAKQTTQEMRTMLFTLRPVVLEEDGLVAALETFVSRLRDQDKLDISLESDVLPRLEGKVEDVTFAILQEAIGNAKKYAGGAPIRVRLIKGQSMIVGQVEDKGPGFDLKAVTASYGSRASLGLLNMQERAEMVGGQVKIDTAPGKGTIVSLAVPFERE